MKIRLLILLGVFAFGLAGVYGFYTYLDSQVPKGDPKFQKEAAEPAGPIQGGQPIAPEA